MADFLSNFTNDKYNETDNESVNVNNNASKKDVDKPTEKKVENNIASKKNVTNATKKETVTKSINMQTSGKTTKENTVTTDTNEESLDEEKFVIMNHETKKTEKVVHEEVVDKDYKKKKYAKMASIALIVILIILFLIWFIRSLNDVKMIDLTDKSLSEVNTWVKSNNITLVTTSVYNDDYEEGNIISQSVDINKKINKGSSVSVVVSLGSDPDVSVTVPDFTGKSSTYINSFIDDNHLLDANILYMYSDIKEGIYVKHEYKSSNVIDSNFKRGDTVNFYISKGTKPINENITVPDFVGKQKSDVEAFSKSSNVVINYSTAYSDTAALNEVISQSINAGEVISETRSISVVISLGKQNVMPNFVNSPLDTVKEYCATESIKLKITYAPSNSVTKGNIVSQSVEAYSPVKSSLSVVVSLGTKITVIDYSSYYKEDVEAKALSDGLTPSIKMQYSNSYSYGKFISQSIKATSTIYEEDNKNIVFTYSNGKPFVTDLKGKLQKDIDEMIYELNRQGASLNVEYIEVEALDEEEKGTIKEVKIGSKSIINSYIDCGSKITVEIYR